MLNAAWAGKYLDDLDRAAADIANSLAEGRVQDWAEYKRMVGMRAGLLAARAAAVKRFSVDEDFDAG